MLLNSIFKPEFYDNLKQLLTDAVQKDRVSDISGKKDQEIEQWVTWATSHADRLDPLKPSPPSILDEEDLEEDETQGFRYKW